MTEVRSVIDGALAFGVFRLWTFGSCGLLIDAMCRFGFREWKEIEDFSHASSPRSAVSRKLVGLEVSRPLASMLASPATDSRSGGTIEAVLEVSPFDARFPVIDWRTDLSQERKRRRRSIGSRISAWYLRDVHEYPSTLTLKLTAASPQVLSTVFRSFCASIPDVLTDIPDVAGAGLLTDGGFVLPPESMASRIEQISELRAKVDCDYPVVYISAAQSTGRSGGMWVAEGDLTFDAGASNMPSRLRIPSMPEAEYRHHLIARGIFETPDGALVLGDRQNHELHAAAVALYESTDRTLCPLTNATLNLALMLPTTKQPFLLVGSERCRRLSACVDAYSSKLSSGAARSIVGAGWIQALMGCPEGISPDTARALRTLWQ